MTNHSDQPASNNEKENKLLTSAVLNNTSTAYLATNSDVFEVNICYVKVIRIMGILIFGTSEAIKNYNEYTLSKKKRHSSRLENF